MGLNLQRPLCFFDLETTGINVVKDRIVEIAVLKLLPNGNKESKTWLVNPEMPIPKGASDIHGITDEKVKDSPNFKTLSTEIYSFMKDCDWAGYNSDRFDIPLIAEEFMRAGVDFDLKFRLNKMLPHDIAVFDVIKMEQDYHAQFDAVERAPAVIRPDPCLAFAPASD